MTFVFGGSDCSCISLAWSWLAELGRDCRDTHVTGRDTMGPVQASPNGSITPSSVPRGAQGRKCL